MNCYLAKNVDWEGLPEPFDNVRGYKATMLKGSVPGPESLLYKYLFDLLGQRLLPI